MSKIKPGGKLVQVKAHRPAPGLLIPVSPGGKLKPGGQLVQVKPHQGQPGGGKLTPVSAKRAKKASHAKKAKRGLARSASEVACCAAEALAASLRLAGGAVSDEDVLALYWHTARDADAGASVLATLSAASAFGLGGHRPASFKEVMPHEALSLQRRETGAGLILGVDLPGPHTVLDDGAAWWSWGEPFDPAGFPGAVIEEAWAVRWN